MVAPLKALIDANPELRGGLPVQPHPGQGVRIHTVRAQQPGGELMGYVPQEGLLWFEQLYRVLPPDGMYDAVPNRPLTFSMGAFHVPKTMVLVIVDYAFDIYRFSGANANDYLPIESRRLSTQVGWDINIDGQRPANLNMQIFPKTATQSQQPFAAPTGPNQPAQSWQFEAVRASQQQVPAGPGLSLLPQRPHRNGLVPLSNTYVAKSNQTLNVACSVVNQIPIPIAFFEANICGVLLPQNVYAAYQEAGVPIGNPLVQPIPGAP